jgi:hypothetical protein
MVNTALIVLSVLALCGSRVSAQDWPAVQALPPNTPVRITELGGSGREIRGRIGAVDDTQLILLRGNTSVPVPKTSIARIDQERRDPIWEGILIGALSALAMRLAFNSEACARSPDPQCTITGLAVGAAVGGFIDFQIRGYRRVYDAPGTVAALLRLPF